MGWQQPPLPRLPLPPTRDGHLDPKELLRSPLQPDREQEHPAAPFAGLAPGQRMFLGGLGLGKDVTPGRAWQGSASGKSRWKAGCQGNAAGKDHIKRHKFPNHFSEQTPLILVPWDQTQNK